MQKEDRCPRGSKICSKRHALLDESNPYDQPKRKITRVDAPVQQPSPAPQNAELLLCQCSPAARQLVLDERREFQGRWEHGWCHHCARLAPWMKQPGLQGATEATTLTHVKDASIMKQLLSERKATKGDRRGNRHHPEPPRLVAKVCKEKGRGELWLGPLPTEQSIDEIFHWANPSIQIFCFADFPDKVRVEPAGEWGMFIPGTIDFRFDIANPQSRTADLKAMKSCLVDSLRQGDNAYVHSVSDISTAPIAAATLGAILMGISFWEAQNIIEQTCSMARSSFIRWANRKYRHGTREDAAWIISALREEVTHEVAPTGYSYHTAGLNAGLVHATILVDAHSRPICGCTQGNPTNQDFKCDIITKGSMKEAANQLGHPKFCADCEILLKASLRIQVNRLFG